MGCSRNVRSKSSTLSSIWSMPASARARLDAALLGELQQMPSIYAAGFAADRKLMLAAWAGTAGQIVSRREPPTPVLPKAKAEVLAVIVTIVEQHVEYRAIFYIEASNAECRNQ